jgi:rhamnosyltransferase subunit B
MPASAPEVPRPVSERLHVLLPTLGSAGDVHPFIALALALQARGHRATVLTNPLFQALIERQGLGFEAVGSIELAYAAIRNPDLWHPRKGLRYVLQIMAPAVTEVYRILARRADGSTVVVASSLALGARVAQDKLGLPTATVHLQPSVIRSIYDQTPVGPWRWSASLPPWVKASLFRLIDWLALDRDLEHAVNALRTELGLAAIDRLLLRWLHSPQAVIGFFPEWFASAQPDWPPQTRLVGFPLWDGSALANARGMAVAALSADRDSICVDTAISGALTDAEQFLAAGDAPLVFTAGSAAAGLDGYFAESIRAAQTLGRRALLVTNFPEQLPRRLPSSIGAFGYVPFSRLLPRAALLIHHGGIGTLAQAVSAGIPQLLVPRGFDQFDNAARIERYGLGRTLTQRDYGKAAAARVLARMLGDEAMRQRCRRAAASIDSVSTLQAACRIVEGLTERRASGP